MVNKAFIFPKFMQRKNQINKQNTYLLLGFLQSGSVPELDMHESKHFLPGQFVHSDHGVYSKRNISDQSAIYETFQIGKRYISDFTILHLLRCLTLFLTTFCRVNVCLLFVCVWRITLRTVSQDFITWHLKCHVIK